MIWLSEALWLYGSVKKGFVSSDAMLALVSLDCRNHRSTMFCLSQLGKPPGDYTLVEVISRSLTKSIPEIMKGWDQENTRLETELREKRSDLEGPGNYLVAPDEICSLLVITAERSCG